jgi:hypothetical protein
MTTADAGVPTAIETPRLVHGSSPVAGEGAFCRENIAAGEIVAFAMAGRPVARDEYETIDWTRYSGRIMQVGEDAFLEGTGDVVDFINHSCEPNLGFDATGQYFVALRDLAVGEEVFFDYSTSEDEAGWRVPCSCGSPRCRGAITGFRDLPATEKARLLPICLPYLREAYGAALNGDDCRSSSDPPGSGDPPA